jgi:Cysteine sulfinate desulfinase/cysteine desulfurase and related enzymes
MNDKIYLDNNATTKIDDRVLEIMLPYFKDEYGNPSSTYDKSKNIKKEINRARENIAKFLNADTDEIIFTSGASESNTTAILSAIKTNESKKHIITTKIEHSSILETMKYVESLGYEITYLSVDKYGNIYLEELESSIKEDTLLISIMYANNEIGNINPIEKIGEIAKRNNILFHTDAVQAFGKLFIDVKKDDIDMLSISGHKIYAPKGIGILYKKKNLPFTPLIFGHQENNMRGGTENVPYIIAFGKAVELLNYNKEENIEIEKLRDYLESELTTKISNTVIYGNQNNRLGNTLNIAIDGVNGEELLILLNQNNIFVSTGSACNSTDISPSHVLVAMNADLEKSSPIRISLGKYNNKEEIDITVKKIINIVSMLRKRDNK